MDAAKLTRCVGDKALIGSQREQMLQKIRNTPVTKVDADENIQI